MADPAGFDLQSPQTVGPVTTRRCTPGCLGRCALSALTATQEGSGLGKTIPGAEPRCPFHLDLLTAPQYQMLRSSVFALLRSVRSAREKANRPAAFVRATRTDPPCTVGCLTRCGRRVLGAGVEGSGLGMPRGAACRFHLTLVRSDRTRRLRFIVWYFLSLFRRARIAASAAAQGVRAAARVTARAVVPGKGGARALRRGARRELAMALPRDAWRRLRHRARVWGEACLRRSIPAITELLIVAVPKPKAPVRSVAHVSIISHKQYMLSRLARDHGLKGTFLALNTHPGAHLGIGFDYELAMDMPPLKRYLKSWWYLWRVLAFHDVVHYHFNGFLFDDGTDLRVLQRMGKVVVVHYRGCDLRCRSVNTAKNPELNVCQECSYPPGSCDTDYQRGKIAVSRAHSDVRFVTTPDLLDFADDAEHLPFIAPYAIDFSAIAPAPRRPDVFRVVTSSNHPALDGVRFVRDAVDRLAAEGVKIELVEVHRQPFLEALSLYKSADLYCGKLRMGYYNNANIESLMLGVPNMCYIRDRFLDRIPDSPIIVARPDNVYAKLREWVAKPEQLKRLGALGPEFVRRHHQADQLMLLMIARYNEALQRKAATRYEAALQSSTLH